MEKMQGAVVDRRGTAIGSVNVTVYNAGLLTKPTIYSDNGINPQANPFDCDSMGRWAFYVANGRYDIEFSGAMITTYKLTDVLVEESGEADAVRIQGHDVNETALGDDKVLVYKIAGDEFVYEGKGTPSAHAESHEDGGDDEISVAGLSGLLATAQTPAAHKTAHENGGGDEISVAGLSGLLADGQTPLGHKTSHENDGSDEISVEGLSGTLADPQTPDTHAASHQDDGGDEISVAGLSGVLADKQDADKIQGHTVDEAAIGDDKILVYKASGDKFAYEAKGTPAAHALSHQLAGGDEINVGGLGGVLVDAQNADYLQGHVIDETARANDRVLVYKTSGDKFVYEAKGTPAAHATTHQDGGGDEISVAGLSGALADKQDADKIQGHAVDEDAIADDTILVYKTSGDKFIYEEKGTPSAHAASHENGGGDEISVAGLSGTLADPQTPAAHAAEHQSGGGDAIKLDDLAAPDNNTDLNVSTAKHGLCPILPDDATKFLRGDGSYAVPPTVREIVFCIPGALETGDKAPWIHLPFAGSVVSAYAVLKTPSSTGAVTIDILKCTDPTAGSLTWTTIFTNKITVDANERTTETAATPSSLNGAQTFAIDDLYRINIDGAGVGANDLTVGLKISV